LRNKNQGIDDDQVFNNGGKAIGSRESEVTHTAKVRESLYRLFNCTIFSI
jgi:hypothetical protein